MIVLSIQNLGEAKKDDIDNKASLVRGILAQYESHLSNNYLPQSINQLLMVLSGFGIFQLSSPNMYSK
jgi:hypothetical protein